MHLQLFLLSDLFTLAQDMMLPAEVNFAEPAREERKFINDHENVTFQVDHKFKNLPYSWSSRSKHINFCLSNQISVQLHYF